MRKSRSIWFIIAMVLIGAAIGGFIGQFLSQYEFFKWMSFGGENGYLELFDFSFYPLFDAHVLSIGFSIAMRLNAGSVIGMILSLFSCRGRR